MVRLIAGIVLLVAAASAEAVTSPEVDNLAVFADARGLARLSATQASAVPEMALAAAAAPDAPLLLAPPPAPMPGETIADLLPDGLTLMILTLVLALFGIVLRRRVPTVSA